jgi:hypothetical protein
VPKTMIDMPSSWPYGPPKRTIDEHSPPIFPEITRGFPDRSGTRQNFTVLAKSC